jgi:chromosomal replication initiator protein
MNYWDQLRNHLQQKVSQQSYDNWLKGTAFIGVEGKTLLVAVPDRETRAWLETEYAAIIRAALLELKLPVAEVGFETQIAVGTLNHALAEGAEIDARANPLNPKFTFQSFVVGACNQFAAAAAKSVAENPSRSYNPLFLYGGVGMGKTHLMHAIGREMSDRYASMRVIYTSSERFMNEMIACIRTERMQQFHQRYRAADVQ